MEITKYRVYHEKGYVEYPTPELALADSDSYEVIVEPIPEDQIEFINTEE